MYIETKSVSQERLTNLIIYVLMDYNIRCCEVVKNYPELDNEPAQRAMAMQEPILKIRDNPQHIWEITRWVYNHIEYVDNPENIDDPNYKELILDAMTIIYYDDFTAEGSGIDYALCKEAKYDDYIEKRPRRKE